MKILAVADEESPRYYDHYRPGLLDEFDLILSCGDLNARYLEFLVTMARCPLLYVRGNHDGTFGTDPPEGCVCVEDQIYLYKGIRILGLGGSFRYRDGANFYTERQMERRIQKLSRSLRLYRGFDILLTHAPARHFHDFESLSHRGFECFTGLLDKYQPRYFLHGHIHRNYGMKIPQKDQYGNTTVINAYDSCAFDYEKG